MNLTTPTRSGRSNAVWQAASPARSARTRPLAPLRAIADRSPGGPMITRSTALYIRMATSAHPSPNV